MRKTTIIFAALALGLTLASSSTFAQSRTYPMTISSPAFGPGVSASNLPVARPAEYSDERSSYAYAPSAQLPDVSEIYPMTISSPAFGPSVTGAVH